MRMCVVGRSEGRSDSCWSIMKDRNLLRIPKILWPKPVSYLSQHLHFSSFFKKTRVDLNFLKFLIFCLKTLLHLHDFPPPLHLCYIIRSIFYTCIHFTPTNTFLKYIFNISSHKVFMKK